MKGKNSFDELSKQFSEYFNSINNLSNSFKHLSEQLLHSVIILFINNGKIVSHSVLLKTISIEENNLSTSSTVYVK